MVTFTTADLPSNIVTVEEVNAWSSLVLAKTAGTILIQEIAGAPPELAASSNPFQILAEASDYHHRLLSRTTLRMFPDWYSRKLWKAVQELTTGTVPAEFKQI